MEMKKRNKMEAGKDAGLPMKKKDNKVESSLRPYGPPRIVSAEDLEAAAATCDPPAGGFGKQRPIPCGTLGS